MVEKELKRLAQNLEKKNEMLDRLHDLCDKQFLLLDDADMTAEVFDACMDEQDELLQELIALDEETEKIYESLQVEKVIQYDGVIQKEYLESLTSQIMDKTCSLQEKEVLKKQKMGVYFESVRRSLGIGRKTSKAALDYYKSMNRSNIIPPQFMDQKK